MDGERFGSRFAFVAASIGMAVGAGNIWRFPRVVAEWGGGTFLIILVLANLIWAIPLLMAESVMGSRSRLGTIGAIREFMGRNFAWVGAWVGLVTVGIMFYYSVVSGWGLRYFVYGVTGELTSTTDSEALWESFVSSPAQTVFFHLLAIAAVAFVVARGLKGGIEAVLSVAIPALFVLLAILTLRAVTLPGAAEGLRYMFVPEWGRFGEADVWLQAFTQCAFSTGAGWGLYITYAVYMRRREDVAVNAGLLAGGNLLASLLAGTTILCTIFALRGASFAQEALSGGNVGEGLAFIYLVELLGEMPGGAVFAPLFFLAFTLAAASTLIAMVELAVLNLINLGLSRQAAAVLTGCVTFAIGLPSALNIDFLTNQDSVWGIALLISGVLVALATIKYGTGRMREHINEVSDVRVGRWWTACIYLIPALFAVLFAWWLSLAVSSDPQSWWNPFTVFSAGTLLAQWMILFAAVYALNDRLSSRIARVNEKEH